MDVYKKEFTNVKTRVELRRVVGTVPPHMEGQPLALFFAESETAVFVFAPFDWKQAYGFVESDRFKKLKAPGTSRQAYKQLLDDLASADPDKEYAYYLVTQ